MNLTLASSTPQLQNFATYSAPPAHRRKTSSPTPTHQLTRDEAISLLRDRRIDELPDGESVLAAAFDLTEQPARYDRRDVPAATLAAGVYGFIAADSFRLLEVDANAIERYHGITPERAEAIGIRSFPATSTGRLIIDHAIGERFGWRPDLPAGLYLDGERVRTCFPENGFGVPCRNNRAGFIHAWLHYRHAQDESPRWITPAKHGGAKAVPTVHLAGRSNAVRSGVIVLTDHALRAEAIYKNGAITVAAMNGCTPSAVVAQLREAYPALRGVMLHVTPEPALCRALKLSGLDYEVTV